MSLENYPEAQRLKQVAVGRYRSFTTPTCMHQNCRSTRYRFSFLNLPAELRNIIYEATLIASSELDASFNYPSRDTFGCGNTTPFLITAALVRTCRQIYNEANPIIYARNSYYVGRHGPTFEGTADWLARIGAPNARLVRAMTVEVNTLSSQEQVYEFLVFLAELGKATRVEDLSLWVGRGTMAKIETERLVLGELGRFAHLTRVTIGAFYPTRWPDILDARFARSRVHVEYAAADSRTWNAILDDRMYWTKKIRTVGVRMTRALLDQKIEEWDEEVDKALWQTAHGYLPRSICSCFECHLLRESFTHCISASVQVRSGEDRDNRINYSWSRERRTHLHRDIEFSHVQKRALKGIIEGGADVREFDERVDFEKNTQPEDGFNIHSVDNSATRSVNRGAQRHVDSQNDRLYGVPSCAERPVISQSRPTLCLQRRDNVPGSNAILSARPIPVPAKHKKHSHPQSTVQIEPKIGFLTQRSNCTLRRECRKWYGRSSIDQT